MSMKNLRTLLNLAAISLSVSYDEIFTTKEPLQKIDKSKHKPLTAGQKRLFGEPKREIKEFSIKGHKVMAFSKKDAITKLKHQKKI